MLKEKKGEFNEMGSSALAMIRCGTQEGMSIVTPLMDIFDHFEATHGKTVDYIEDAEEGEAVEEAEEVDEVVASVKQKQRKRCCLL